MSKYKVTISGFKSQAEAETFVMWYCEQGEQDIDVWLEDKSDEVNIRRHLTVDLRATFPVQWTKDNVLLMAIK